ncbi:hypothetical protein MNBD_GAMMA22-2873 [hydrothermal vent metagenome]|uniref:4Fe-4S ferredoxin-type domain-containing protein n=1 Tax=hydrothermal vent metagenome TaxID=652676 RepID=A0A3B1AN35_9ZZZZ
MEQSSKLRHFNKVRWFILSVVFTILILLPFIHLYQTYEAAHAYNLLSATEKNISDTMEFITSPFVDSPEQLDFIKGNTWSATLFGFKISDPLAVLSQIFSSQEFYLTFLLTALVPLLATLILGRVYCGWICPASLIYELNENLATWLRKAGFPSLQFKIDNRIKYLVLILGLVLSMYFGTVMVASIYPPAIIGREIYYAIALGSFGSGALFFIATLLFDLLLGRRGFCRYVCPGGTLYSILGRYRLIRIKRTVENCNDCSKCNVVCQFGLNPLQDDFGMECNNCTACMAVCPTAALEFTINFKDVRYQGPGHLGHQYKKAIDDAQ